ncbi:MAG: peptidase domain-containing ABC transporter [Bacteroidota bacterium]
MKRRNRICIRQRDASDCGPACISSVMAHYGMRIPVSRIRQLARTDHQGTSMYGMVQALKQLDFEARGLQGSADHMDKLPLPFIAHLVRKDGNHHYVTVYNVNGKSLKIMDPADGEIKRRQKTEFGECWSGSVIAMVPGTKEQPFSPDIPNNTRLRILIKPVWKPVLQAVISAILYTLLGLSSSIYLGKLSDHVFVTHNEGLLNLMSLVMIWITLLMVFLACTRNTIMLKTGQVIDNQLIISYYRHLFSLPQRFFDSMKTGEIISRVNDAVKIRGFINDAAIGILVNLLILLFSFSAMFLLHPRLSLIMLVMIPAYSLVYIIFNHRNKRIERKVMEKSASLEEQFVESLQASSHIRQHNLVHLTQEKTEKKLNSLLDTVYSSGINAITASTGTETINRIFTIILLWAGSYFVIRDSLSPGNLLTFYALMGYCTGPISGLIGANKTYQNAMIAADRLFEIFHLEKEQKPGLQVMKKAEFGTISLKGIFFSYGSRGQQLSGVDLLIPEGGMTALTGPSGSGKSTVARLVQHLYPPDRGIITIRGCDTRYFTRESIRSLMGVVPQQISFLSGNFLDNIAPGETEPDLPRIIQLINDVGLMQLIESLPEGLGSPVKMNGTNLSGGERQRLAMVRALYRDPEMIILDEPASSLDPLTEVYINRLLLSLKEQGKTILLITHKSQYASLADQVYEMEQGRIRNLVRPNRRNHPVTVHPDRLQSGLPVPEPESFSKD